MSFDKEKSIFNNATKPFVVGNLLALLLLGQNTAPAQQNHGQSRPLPDFNYTQGWLGADDAYSVPIGPNRSVWLFGDTFVGTADTKLRRQAKTMVHNSVGISECEPGMNCTLNYFWHDRESPKPRSFFDTGTDELYYWPLDGLLEGKTLYLSLLAVRNKPGASLSDAFGFEIVGTKLATIDDVQSPPEKWHVGVQDLTDAHLWMGASLVRDGKYVIWYTEVSEGEGRGFMTEMRLPRDKMAKPSGNWEYLDKDNHWVAGLAGKDAMHVIEQPISEMSVRYHPAIKKWLALSPGPDFPSPWAVVRSSDSPIGPWSSPKKIYEFPEMKRDNPGYDKDTFCYAVKEHIEFSVDKIALTYACNSMVLSKTMADMNIYRPRAVVLDLPK